MHPQFLPRSDTFHPSHDVRLYTEGPKWRSTVLGVAAGGPSKRDLTQFSTAQVINELPIIMPQNQIEYPSAAYGGGCNTSSCQGVPPQQPNMLWQQQHQQQAPAVMQPAMPGTLGGSGTSMWPGNIAGPLAEAARGAVGGTREPYTKIIPPKLVLEAIQSVSDVSATKDTARTQQCTARNWQCQSEAGSRHPSPKKHGEARSRSASPKKHGVPNSAATSSGAPLAAPGLVSSECACADVGERGRSRSRSLSPKRRDEGARRSSKEKIPKLGAVHGVQFAQQVEDRHNSSLLEERVAALEAMLAVQIDPRARSSSVPVQPRSDHQGDSAACNAADDRHLLRLQRINGIWGQFWHEIHRKSTVTVGDAAGNSFQEEPPTRQDQCVQPMGSVASVAEAVKAWPRVAASSGSGSAATPADPFPSADPVAAVRSTVSSESVEKLGSTAEASHCAGPQASASKNKLRTAAPAAGREAIRCTSSIRACSVPIASPNASHVQAPGSMTSVSAAAKAWPHVVAVQGDDTPPPTRSAPSAPPEQSLSTHDTPALGSTISVAAAVKKWPRIASAKALPDSKDSTPTAAPGTPPACKHAPSSLANESVPSGVSGHHFVSGCAAGAAVMQHTEIHALHGAEASDSQRCVAEASLGGPEVAAGAEAPRGHAMYMSPVLSEEALAAHNALTKGSTPSVAATVKSWPRVQPQAPVGSAAAVVGTSGAEPVAAVVAAPPVTRMRSLDEHDLLVPSSMASVAAAVKAWPPARPVDADQEVAKPEVARQCKSRPAGHAQQKAPNSQLDRLRLLRQKYEDFMTEMQDELSTLA
eukprot:gnl/TRDRNA2_/TRDRNA2_43306_c0_seq1.p1 gnl/TRDRNA2_/TRDRNA2_43306_c0~~gnl/TRDRNA2_/TRDRNA2_43306_c0_seq1.p1  ORF type:complete len:813 (-),score=127.40 gnl/TRDRNA2_/TRDRNA2_43306_c0_seq1:321-2759(-)